MKGISIIICAYNSGEKLQPTLDHLAKQKGIAKISFELIIVDNNCTDNTIEIAKEAWHQAGNPFILKIIKEPEAGLNFARVAGIKAATNEYIILCDDDNWLDEDYVLKVYNHFENMPEVAIVGGVGEAVSNIALPSWFNAVEGFGYAVGREGRSTGYVSSVYGAGMGLRKSVFETLIKRDSFSLTDRKEKSLSSGGDSEICLLIKEAGYKIYLDETMLFKHFLNRERLTWNYYLKLRRSFGEATAVLQKKANGIKPTGTFKSKLSTIKLAFKNMGYLIAPLFFKNKACANFIQEWARRKAFYK